MKISFANRVYASVVIALTVTSCLWLNSYTEDTPRNFFYIATFFLSIGWLICFVFIGYIILLVNWDDITDWLNDLDK